MNDCMPTQMSERGSISGQVQPPQEITEFQRQINLMRENLFELRNVKTSLDEHFIKRIDGICNRFNSTDYQYILKNGEMKNSEGKDNLPPPSPLPEGVIGDLMALNRDLHDTIVAIMTKGFGRLDVGIAFLEKH